MPPSLPQRPEPPRTSFVGAIAAIHKNHEDRIRRAEAVRNVGVAGLDPIASSVVSALASRVGASVVPLEEARLAVHSPGPLAAVPPPRALVVDLQEFHEMVTAFEATYRPAATEEAVKRARAQASATANQSRATRTPTPLAAKGRSAGMRMKDGAGKGPTPAELDLQRRAREERAA